VFVGPIRPGPLLSSHVGPIRPVRPMPSDLSDPCHQTCQTHAIRPVVVDAFDPLCVPIGPVIPLVSVDSSVGPITRACRTVSPVGISATTAKGNILLLVARGWVGWYDCLACFERATWSLVWLV
jgi:hypothetical protein